MGRVSLLMLFVYSIFMHLPKIPLLTTQWNYLWEQKVPYYNWLYNQYCPKRRPWYLVRPLHDGFKCRFFPFIFHFWVCVHELHPLMFEWEWVFMFRFEDHFSHRPMGIFASPMSRVGVEGLIFLFRVNQRSGCSDDHYRSLTRTGCEV